MVTKPIKFFEREDIEQITLLTIEQAEKVPKNVLARNDWWWLRTAGQHPNFAAFVDEDGDIYEEGFIVYHAYNGVRPAFRITGVSLDFNELVYIGKLPCTAIDKDLVLANELICDHRFGRETNDWETSEIKAFIESSSFWDEYIEKEKE